MKKIIILFLFCFGFIQNTKAIPSNQKSISTILADGRTLTFTIYGDEFYRIYKTSDQYIILYDQSKWVYACLDHNDYLIPSKYTACNEEFRTMEEKQFLSSISKNISYHPNQLKEFKKEQDKESFSKVTQTNFPTTGSPRLLIILVEFNDNSFKYSLDDFRKMAMQSNYPGSNPSSIKTGSIRDYYFDNSFGKLDLQIDVVGPYKLANNHEYYGANRANGEDRNTKSMIKEACYYADSIGGVDFSQYDNDYDGVVDAVHVFYAGHSEAATGEPDLIWPHRSTLTGASYIIDGKRILDYSCSSELEGSGNQMDGIGTVCHEFGHLLGLPDFYDTDYEKSGGYAFHLYGWSLMASGAYNNNANTPPFLTALEKEMLNWHEFTPLVDPEKYILPIWGSDYNSISYQLTTLNDDEYFLLENRQKQDWDAYIPGAGMLIYHVDRAKVNTWYDGFNNINANPFYRGYHIVCADNREDLSSFEGDPYPGSTGNTSFTDYSTPRPILWDKNISLLNKPITKIEQLEDNTIQFQYRYNIISGRNVLCDTLLENMEPISGLEIENAKDYLWQIQYNNSEWVDAPGINNEVHYKINQIYKIINVRRIVVLNDMSSDTSNTIQVKLDLSIGGHISYLNDTIILWETGKNKLELSNYEGNIIQWEAKKGDEEWERIESNKPVIEPTYHLAGTYMYRAKIQNSSCPPTYSESAKIIVEPNLQSETVINIFPNPNTGILYIATGNNATFDVYIDNVSGQNVWHKKDINPNYEPIAVNHLKKGVYIMTLINNDLKIKIHEKIIINN